MASERVILHCDMNCFYASCEMAYNPMSMVERKEYLEELKQWKGEDV